MKREKGEAEKKTRRSPGDGSVYKRKDGRYVASITLPDGSKKSTYHENEKEANQARRKALREMEQGTLVTGQDQSLKSYLEYWLSIQKNALKETTYAMYSRYCSNIVIPVIGNIKLTKLTGDMFQAMYGNWQEEEMSPNTIRLIHVIIKKALQDAVKWKKLAYNPVKDVTPPRALKHEMAVLDQEQAKKLLSYAKHTKLDCILTLAVSTGMRRGELLGLRWADIDFATSELHVQRSLSYIEDPETGHYKFVEDAPKTTSSKRTVALPKFVVDILREHQSVQSSNRLRSHQWEDKDLVFCNRDGNYIHPINIISDFKNLLVLAGLPDMRFHDLRHSAATILLSLNVPIKVIQELLGHENIRTTMGIYAHALPIMHKEAMNTLDSAFGNKETTNQD